MQIGARTSVSGRREFRRPVALAIDAAKALSVLGIRDCRAGVRRVLHCALDVVACVLVRHAWTATGT